MPTYRLKPPTIEAVQITERMIDEGVKTTDGDNTIEYDTRRRKVIQTQGRTRYERGVGDWMVTIEGVTSIVFDADFREVYEEVT